MYVKTNWVDDVTPISSEKLNKIEQGVSSLDRVAGIYVGDGAPFRKVLLGFTPSSVFVCDEDGSTHYKNSGDYRYNGGLALTNAPIKTGFTTTANPVTTVNEFVLEIVAGGFKVYYTSYKRNSDYSWTTGINTNANGKTLHYIAHK